MNYWYNGKKYVSLDDAKKALLEDVRESHQTDALMGRANTWTVPNWRITADDGAEFWASEIWADS